MGRCRPLLAWHVGVGSGRRGLMQGADLLLNLDGMLWLNFSRSDRTDLSFAGHRAEEGSALCAGFYTSMYYRRMHIHGKGCRFGFCWLARITGWSFLGHLDLYFNRSLQPGVAELLDLIF